MLIPAQAQFISALSRRVELMSARPPRATDSSCLFSFIFLLTGRDIRRAVKAQISIGGKGSRLPPVSYFDHYFSLDR